MNADAPTALGRSETRVPERAVGRETAAPFFGRQMEWEGIAVIRIDRDADDDLHGPLPAKHSVRWGRLPWRVCPNCQRRHHYSDEMHIVADSDSEDEANAAFDVLERKLLAGELG